MTATSNLGWTTEIEEIIKRIPTREFKLEDLYRHIPYLQSKFPNNHFIKDKIRQQLQVLRDKGILEFLDDHGHYRKL